MKDTNILFITDIHQKEEYIKKINFSEFNYILCGGDFIDPSFPDLRLCFKILDLLPERTVLVPGNCDNDEVFINSMQNRFRTIHKKLIKIDDFNICGIGYSRSLKLDLIEYRKYFLEDPERAFLFARHSKLKFILDFCGLSIKGNQIVDSDFDLSIIKHIDFINKFKYFLEEEIDLFFNEIEDLDNGIILTHSPAYSLLDKPDYLPNIGSISIKKAIDKFKPALVLCGHFHELSGSIDYNGTRIFNPGALKDGYFGIIEILNDKFNTKSIKI